MSDTIGPLTPGGNILVQPLGSDEAKTWIPTSYAGGTVWTRGSALADHIVSTVRPWNSGKAVGGPRDGEILGSAKECIHLPINSTGWHSAYVWNNGCWVAETFAAGEEKPHSFQKQFQAREDELRRRCATTAVDRGHIPDVVDKDGAFLIPAHLHQAVTDDFILEVEEVDTGRNPAPADPVRDHVDAVIGDLSTHKVSDVDRGRLRDAVDKADKPDTSRQGADRLLGRAIGRKVAMDFGVRTTGIPYSGYRD